MTQPAATEQFSIEECRSCNKPVIWAVTTNAKSMPVDAEPVAKGGNIVLEARPDGMKPLARVLTVAEQFGRRNLRTSHFATCPQAGQWRGGRNRRKP